MSKMTVLNDSEKNLYLKLAFVEFLDFLCRTTYAIVRNEKPLHEKLIIVLKKLFTSYNQKYNDQYEDDSDDDDDDDYDDEEGEY